MQRLVRGKGMGDLVSQDTGKGKKEEREGQGRNEKNNKKTRTSLVIGHSKKSGTPLPLRSSRDLMVAFLASTLCRTLSKSALCARATGVRVGRGTER